ncbi:hypothetical protein Poli38472_010529 [Pythium oligandrum]|uniref:Uncharacterized protein n=1 Tax=Pythium oligandrum TaxID=41045 RepID=A0A8K1C3V3_PYTOL|nr:hypothetical protein Poli38472_010529 [Pythium oligandrum]|eukprot:TMW55647.1 hypothetical protein Poli38472_010529 [Pythium oligandrum]
MEPEELTSYVASLVHCLRWMPATDVNDETKTDFIEALTEISALPAESIDMEVRRLLVEDTSDAIKHVVSALSCRDVLLKCKAANAIGSICTSRVAGQRLLDVYGEELITSLTKMATTKNTWAQADAYSVFGWMVVIAEESMVQQLARLVPAAIKLLQRNLSAHPSSTREEDANLCIYCLVFLLNFTQRDVSVFNAVHRELLLMLQQLIARLVHDPSHEAEGMELVRLTVTLLSTLVDQSPDTTSLILELKMLPELLKLRKRLQSTELQVMLGPEDVDDLQQRMAIVNDAVLARR